VIGVHAICSSIVVFSQVINFRLSFFYQQVLTAWLDKALTYDKSSASLTVLRRDMHMDVQ